MKNYNLKFILALSISCITLLSCSFLYEKVDNFAKKLEKKLDDSDVVVLETDTPSKSLNDMIFYNKYLEGYYKFRRSGDEVFDNYKKDVPTPAEAKSKMLVLIVYNIYLNNMEREIKNYDRSLFDGGELSKLKANNRDLQQNLESSMREILRAAKLYHDKAKITYEFIKDNRKTAAIEDIKRYDDDFMKAHRVFEEAMTHFKQTLIDNKPSMGILDPDKFSGKKKATVILLNAYTEIMDSTEKFHLALMGKTFSDKQEMINSLNSLKSYINLKFNEVMSAQFDDIHKFLKYGFEDYFKKSFDQYAEHTLKAINTFGNTTQQEFYNSTEINTLDMYYGFLLAAYSSGLNSIETLKVL